MATPHAVTLNPDNLAFAEAVYEQFLASPESVSVQWQAYFQQLALETSETPAKQQPQQQSAQDLGLLAQAYRQRGHLAAQFNPLQPPRPLLPELYPAFYGLSETDQAVREAVQSLRQTYCGPVGVQYQHIDDPASRTWLQERIESRGLSEALSPEQHREIFCSIAKASIFEEFLQKKFVGAKTYSLEGAEMMIPLLELAIERAAELGVDEMVLGMAHRGRLNTMWSICGMPIQAVLRRFDSRNPERFMGKSDVKYHDGWGGDRQTACGRSMHVSMSWNPSHLEFVNPVALGRVRAKQDRFGDTQRERGLAVILHGDAAFAGGGVNQECLNFSELAAYRTGGSLHIITNNQIGFTTLPEDGRSTTYSSSLMRMLDCPIFTVNADHPEAVAAVVRLALEFRATFHKDVMIDLYCYRLHGHNEVDEPSLTQPVQYRGIRSRTPVRQAHAARLIEQGHWTAAEIEAHESAWWAHLEEELRIAKAEPAQPAHSKKGQSVWAPYKGGLERDVPEVPTMVSEDRLIHLLQRMTRLPEGFSLHPKLEKWRNHRLAVASGAEAMDWGTAEALAFASLATEGHRVRLSGQDCGRGTFGQRHAVLHDEQTGQIWRPLQNLEPDQAAVEVWNSPLSELAIIGFEYGYSLECPSGLTMWEAQFGDFYNGAQVILDQFLSGGEVKWNRLSGLTLLLPHGYEGVGPEHSSARLKRFLSMAEEDNWQVAFPSTPAQIFHLLRRQVLRPWRKPLIVMGPKVLLRHPRATSPLSALASGGFQRWLPDTRPAASQPIQKVLLCSGKIYLELEDYREQAGRHDIAIVRLEQLYPLESSVLSAALRPYAPGTPVVWVQEEPVNMGAWNYLALRFGSLLLGMHPFSCVGRQRSSSPATGSMYAHKLEQEHLVREAFSS